MSTRKADLATYNYEITDTFGGEANYCWVKRGQVRAKSLRGATRIAKRREGYTRRHVIDLSTGDMQRCKFVGMCVCMFVQAEQ